MALDAAKLQVTVGADVSGAQKALHDVGSQAQSLASQIGVGIAQGVGQAAALGAFNALGGAIGGAASAAMGFEKTMSGINAITGASAETMGQVSALALQIGKDTAFSASEAGGAIEELLKGGVEMQDVLGGAARATVDLAAAGGVSMPEAATLASNAMSVFKIAGTDMAHVADVIAGAANASSIDVSQFGLAMSQAGVVASTVGISFDSLSQGIAVMGNAGLKGSDAGTSLKTMLLNLNPSTKAQREMMQSLGLETTNYAKASELAAKSGSAIQDANDPRFWPALNKAIGENVLGVKDWTKATDAQRKEYDQLLQSSGAVSNAFFDQSGQAKDLAGISQVLQDSLQGMNKQQKLATLEVLFGSDAIRAASIMADQGAAGFDKMAGAMGKVTAQDVGKARLNNLAGDLDTLKGSAETAAIMLGGQFLPVARGLVQWATAGLNAALPIIEQLPQLFSTIGASFSGGGQAANLAPMLEMMGLGGLAPAIDEVARQVGDSFRTIQAIFSGAEWHPDASIDPFVNALGMIAVTLRDTVIPAVTEVVGWIGTNLPNALGEAGGAAGEMLGTIGPIIGDLRVAFAELGAAMGTQLGPEAAEAAAGFNAAAFVFKVLSDTIKGFLAPVALGAAALRLYATTAAALSVQIQALKPQVGEFFNQLGTGAQAVIGNVIPYFTELPGRIGEQLGAMGESIGGAFSALGTNVQDALSTLGGVISGLWQGLVDTVTGFGAAIIDAALAPWRAIPDDIRADLELIVSTVAERAGAMVASWMAQGAALVAGAQSIWNAIAGSVTAFVGGVVSSVTGGFNQASSASTVAWTGMATGISGIIAGIASAIGTWIADRQRDVGVFGDWLGGEASRAWGIFSANVLAPIGELAGRLGTWISERIIQLQTFATNAASEATKIGQAIIDGITGAINSGKDALGETLAGMARGMLASVKSALGIASPSSEFMAIGQNMAASLVDQFIKSIEEKKNTVVSVVSGLASAAGGAIGNAVGAVGGALRSVTAGGAGGGLVKANVGQFGIGLPPAQAMAACGPYAAMVFANAVGRYPTAAEAVQLAREVGWSEGSGMAGPGSEVALLAKMGISAVQQGATNANMAAGLAHGPVAISTAKHYFAATAMDEQGRYNVGGTGTAMRGGKEWMTLGEMDALGGGLQSIIVLTGQMGDAMADAAGKATPAIAGVTDALDMSTGGPFKAFTAQTQEVAAAIAGAQAPTLEYARRLIEAGDAAGVTQNNFRALMDGTIGSKAALVELGLSLGDTNPEFTRLTNQFSDGLIDVDEYVAKLMAVVINLDKAKSAAQQAAPALASATDAAGTSQASTSAATGGDAGDKAKALAADVAAAQTTITMAWASIQAVTAEGVDRSLTHVARFATETRRLMNAEADDARIQGRDIGEAIVLGMAEGLDGADDELSDAAHALADKVLGYVKDKLGISSPSRAFMELAGYSVDGYVVGMKQRAHDVRRAMADTFTLAGSSGYAESFRDGINLGDSPARSDPFDAAARRQGVAGGAGRVLRIEIPLELKGREVARLVRDINLDELDRDMRGGGMGDNY